jgi:hypothetical protein
MKTSINFWHLLLGDVQLGTLKLWNGTTHTERKCKKFRRIPQKKMGINYQKKEIMLLLIELFRKH